MRKQKVQNKLYMNAMKIWDVTYKGQKSSDCRLSVDNKDYLPSLSRLSPDDRLTIQKV